MFETLFRQFLKNNNWEILNYQVPNMVPTVGAAADNFFTAKSFPNVS
jgi:hypothetical protein